MRVVLDSSAALALALQEDAAQRVLRNLRSWLDRGGELHAPALFSYEVANALAGAVFTGTLTPDGMQPALQAIDLLPIEYHRQGHGVASIVVVTRELGRRSAYDATYLALGRELQAQVWPLDGALFRNATEKRFDVWHFEHGPASA